MNHLLHPRMAAPDNISRTSDGKRPLALLLALAASVAWSSIVAAQDRNASPSLEDLIPDSAVENPEDWARDGAPAVPEETQLPPPDAETPLEQLPEFAVDWPEALEIPPIAIPEVDEDIRFAEPDIPSTPLETNGFVATVNDDLVLAFPADPAMFPVRDAFIDRFKTLSTIEELNSDSDNIAQLASRARADEELLVEMLRVYGYYDAQVIRSLVTAEAGEDTADAASARFDIIPGQRYRFGVINLGNLAAAPDAAMLRAAFEIQTGDPLSSDQIVQERADLDLALGENGYPFATMGEADLVIDHREAEGDLTVPVEPKGKYVFGSVTSSLPEFLSGEHLANIARFQPGDVFKRSLETDLRRAILATGLVSSVSIAPREVTPPSGDRPGTVALDVDLAKAPLRTIAGAIGYGSEEGFRVEASWTHRNLFPPEGALKLRGILGTREQLAGVTFTKNNFGGRDHILNVDAYASTLDSDAFDARTVALVGSYERISTLLFQKKFGWAFGGEILATDERNRVIGGIARPRQTFFIGSLFGRVTYDTSDSLLNPMEGFRLSAFAAPEVSRSNNDEDYYIRLQGDASLYQKMNDSVVLAGRLRLASIQGSELPGIAPSRRLYAGGGGSVRGYGFQAIGPTNDLGEPTGGRSLVEVSAEARIKTGLFEGALSVVPFFDAGAVSISQTPDFNFVKYGAGLGVRYDSGFGPLRLDVGVPINPGPFDSPVAVYISLGQAF